MVKGRRKQVPSSGMPVMTAATAKRPGPTLSCPVSAGNKPRMYRHLWAAAPEPQAESENVIGTTPRSTRGDSRSYGWRVPLRRAAPAPRRTLHHKNTAQAMPPRTSARAAAFFEIFAGIHARGIPGRGAAEEKPSQGGGQRETAESGCSGASPIPAEENPPASAQCCLQYAVAHSHAQQAAGNRQHQAFEIC